MDHSQVTIILTSLDHLDEPCVRQFTLTPTSRSIEIGRASGSRSKGLSVAETNAWFNNPVMSRRHGTLFIKPGSQHLFLKDLGSMHGTTLNGKIVQLKKDYKIENNDVIKFGSHIVRGEDSFPARAYAIQYTWTPIVKRTGTSTFTVPDGDSSSDVDSLLESSGDDEWQKVMAPTSVSIRGLLANRKLKMGSRVANVVGTETLQPLQHTKPASEAGNSQQNPVEVDEDDTSLIQDSGAVKEVIPESVMVISETGDTTGSQLATASKEIHPQSQPRTSGASNGAPGLEPVMKSKTTDGNAHAVPEVCLPRDSIPDICKESVRIQNYDSVHEFNDIDEDVNEKYKESEQALKGKDFGDRVEDVFGSGHKLVNRQRRQNKSSPLLGAARDPPLDFSDSYSRSHKGEASPEKATRDVREAQSGYSEKHEKPRHDFTTVPLPVGTVPGFMQPKFALRPPTTQGDRVSKLAPFCNTTAACVPPTQGYRPEPQRGGNQRERPNYHSLTFSDEPLIHGPPSFSPPRPWDMDYGMMGAAWSANLSSNYWDPVRGLHCEDWLAGQNPVITPRQSTSSSRPLLGYGSEFIPSAPYNTSTEPPYFLPTSKIQWGTGAPCTEGFAPSLFKASNYNYDALDKVAPGRSKQPNTQQDTGKSSKFRSPRKQGMSILDIIDPNAPKAMASAAGTKRKLEELSTEPISANADRNGDTGEILAAPCAEASSDDQHQDASVMPNTMIDTAASDACAHHTEEPVPKRARWQFAAGAATGVLVGSLGMLATLVSLPERLFQ